jgi:hypothetical protein
MPKRLTFLITFLTGIFPLFINGQTLQYAKKIRLEHTDYLFLAGSFNDNIHLLKQDGWGKMTLVIYNSNLSVEAAKRLPSEQKGYAEIQIIPYTGYYYAFIHYRESKKYRIIKIDAAGRFEDMTDLLQKKFPTSFLPNTTLWNLRKVNNRMFIVSYVYDNASEKLFFKVINADSTFTKVDERPLIVNYKFGREQINSIFFTDTATAYITRSGRNGTSNYGQVDITKHDLISGTSKNINLTSPKDLFLSPDLKYNDKDSSFYFLATLRDKTAASSITRNYFVRMNKELEELSPSVQVQFKDLLSEKVILVTGNKFPFSFSIDDYKKLADRNRENNFTSMPQLPYDGWGTSQSLLYAEGSSFYYGYSSPPGFSTGGFSQVTRTPSPVDLRIVHVNPDYAGKKDVLLKSKKETFRSQFYNSFNFTSNEKLYVLFGKTYSVIRNGIGYVSIDNGVISDEVLLRVNLKNEYMLTQAKQINEHTVIIPFKYKKELGLLKVNL